MPDVARCRDVADRVPWGSAAKPLRRPTVELQWIVRGSLPVALVLLFVALLSTACSRPRQYPIRGQVLAVDPSRQEMTVKHEDIAGFMPAMTMPFKVRDARVLDERRPGDLISATLVVEESQGYLEHVVKTGEAPLPPDAPAPLASRMLEPGAEVPDAEFIDQESRRRRLSEWHGTTLAVTFVYTRCPVPDFCPLMDRHFKSVQTQIQKDPALRERVQLVSVSFDPDYDTADVLRAHAERIGADPSVWSYVTGEREAIDRFAAGFGVSVIRDDRPMQEIVHNLRTAVIGPDGRLRTVLNGNDWTPDQLLTAIREADGSR